MSTKVEISKRLVLVNSASSVAAKVINISVLVWLHQHLLRRISTEEYSLYPVLMAVMVFAPLLTTILTSALGRYIVEAYAKGDERRVTEIVSTMFPFLLGVGLAILTGGWLFAWFADHVLTIGPERLWDARIMLGLLVFLLAIRLPVAPFAVGLYVRQKFVLLNCIRLCTELLRIGILLTLLLCVSTRVLWVVVASMSASLCSLLVIVMISRRLVPALKFRPREIRWPLVRTLTSFGTWNFVLSAADMIRTGADVIILNKLGTALDVTNFHIGSMAFRQIQTGSYLVRGPLQPPLTAMYATGEKKRLRNTYLRGGRYALWASLFLALPLMIYRKEIITLYVGEQFLAAGTVMALLLATFPISYGNVMMPHLAKATAEMRPWAIRAAVIHSTNLLLTLCLVVFFKMGAVGCALATLTVYVIFVPLFYWPLGLRLAELNFRTWLKQTIWPGFKPALAATIVWIVLRIVMKPDSWASLAICSLGGMFCFLIYLFAFCLTSSEQNDIQRLLRKVWPAAALTRLRSETN